MRPKNIFVIYAHEDRDIFDSLRRHLRPLEKSDLVKVWYDGEILPGQNWESEIKQKLKEADIVLLLISIDFLSSEYINQVELKEVFRQHEEGNKIIVPVIVRKCFWQSMPELARLKVLPSGGRAITEFSDTDKAYFEITSDLYDLIKNYEKTDVAISDINNNFNELNVKPNPVIYKLEDVFTVIGTPTVTFVESDEFIYLRMAINQPGRGIVVEGPSGIGKTSSIEKLLLQLNQWFVKKSALPI